ncbi:MarR family winged helix-turn-helix transcriptional regulator [Novispirillum itersonii]|uniref:DNA-binding MarR family transcriptional regulator n=1 Tax=Novispirillum itersonii TaxID=189 RepID=A0A7X0DPQ1_NOVIT|nr:MarR family winged helix-turn-helix transcriptional regulator [Novispirillum itersonii]MBB6211502.1 DNA-binding MarR family transcriptional regulator [Novispirillum itersonii]
MTAAALAETLETLHRLLHRRWQDGAADGGLSYSEFEYLRALQRMAGCGVQVFEDAPGTPDHGLHLQDLAAALSVSKASVSIAIARLEERGFVRRTPCFRDARAHHLFLTPDGQTALTAAAQRYSDVAAALLSHAPGLDLTALRHALEPLLPPSP